ncbi:hypothetical protein BJF83_21470 [Nocardiopsis sp. CNR-923]|uniref:hypothetical protein n=1 Tax=Nocardiopsis sp. CNR-923 TaxID=1904965 RepID=UPI000965650B|nr:hypothetical protein [Nocardiopsis sp. CNR-923]OLT26373.1 hypothetical protein BJF83_21470 [Nocardiopsis sp. CNR-923]
MDARTTNKITNISEAASEELERVARILGAVHSTQEPESPTTAERAEQTLATIEEARALADTKPWQVRDQETAFLVRLAKATRHLSLAVELLDEAQRGPERATRVRLRTVGDLVFDLDADLTEAEELLRALATA